MKNIIVQLRIFRGKESYDVNGKVTSNVQTMKLKFGRLEWVNFMKTAILVYSKIEVVRCTDMDNDYKEITTPKEVLADVERALKGEEVKLTPQQQEIKELKDAVAELKGKKESKKPESKPKEEKKFDKTPDTDEELEAARVRYEEVFGKKPHYLTALKTINKKIEAELAK